MDYSIIEPTLLSTMQHSSASTSVMEDMSLYEKDLIAKQEKPESQEQAQNAFRISILSSFNKTIDLPAISIWNHLTNSVVAVQGQLTIQVRSGFLLRKNKWILCYCVLSNRGYFVMYVKESTCKGYAVNLKRAKKIEVICQHHESGKNSCTIVVKWKFGTVCIALERNQVGVWRENLLHYFEGDFEDWGNVVSAQIISNYPKLEAEIINQNMHGNVARKVSSFTTKHLESIKPNCAEHLQTINENEAANKGAKIKTKQNGSMRSQKLSGVPSMSSFCATLPIRSRMGYRYCSEGALTFTPNKARYGTEYNKPLDEWLSNVGADHRFRCAKQYFESSN